MNRPLPFSRPASLARRFGLAAAVALLAVAGPARAQEMSCKAHQQHEGHDASAEKHEHAAGVDARGDAVMGFDHEKTTHHFRLFRDGGAIEVTANASDDPGSADAIRGHLSHIARMFAEGDFEAPMIIHDRVPPGVPVLQRRKSTIRWKFEPVAGGGRVVASTRDRQALAALHEFLRFQITDHRTGDPGTIEEAARGSSSSD